MGTLSEVTGTDWNRWDRE